MPTHGRRRNLIDRRHPGALGRPVVRRERFVEPFSESGVATAGLIQECVSLLAVADHFGLLENLAFVHRRSPSAIICRVVVLDW